MKKIALAAAAVAAALTLTACGPQGQNISGTVVDKEFDKGSCKTKWNSTKKKNERKCAADEYELDIRRSDGSTVEIDVSRTTYDRNHIGQAYSR